MTTLVPVSEIQQIVGATRHETLHLGRAVPSKGIYILHPAECRALHDAGERDLRDCPFSLALDFGTDSSLWDEDGPCRLDVDELGFLVGARCCVVCGCIDEAACDPPCWWVGPNLCSGCES